MQKYKILISYDGTDYCGWQRQKPHKHASEKPSLQETMEVALHRLFNEPIDLSASGRTDAGVHAWGQIGHFSTEKALPQDFCWAMRSLLPDSLVVRKIWKAPEEFHATLSATHKTYRYWIWHERRNNPLLHRYSHWIRGPLDLAYLNEQAKLLCKEQDFKSFQSVGTEIKSTIREVYSAKWHYRKPHLLEFEITGSGFLKQMVRNIVGTQLNLCMRNEPLLKMQDILDAKDRTKAGAAAPAQGLFLSRVYYPKELDNKCLEI